ncbi:MAG: hypothetical protein OCD03_03140 [Hyphomicrobiales bacterium]
MTNSVKVVGITLGATALSALPIWMNFSTKLVYNSFASAPTGYYWVTEFDSDSGSKIGSHVIIPTPAQYRLMAAKTPLFTYQCTTYKEGCRDLRR